MTLLLIFTMHGTSEELALSQKTKVVSAASVAVEIVNIAYRLHGNCQLICKKLHQGKDLANYLYNTGQSVTHVSQGVGRRCAF